MDIHGKQFGVCITPRKYMAMGKMINAPLVRILVEDDEAWHTTEVQLDGYWLQDLIDVLTAAKAEVARLKEV